MEPTERVATVFWAIQTVVDDAATSGVPHLANATVSNKTDSATMWGKHGFTVVLPTGEVIEVELRQVK